MTRRIDALQQALEPLHAGELKPEDYSVLGESTMEAVCKRVIQIKYDIFVEPNQDYPSAYWEREGSDFLLSNIAEETYLLNASRRSESGLVIQDMFVFGNPEVAMGGLAHIVKSVSTREKSHRGYILEGKQAGIIRRDDKGLRRVLPTKTSRSLFRRSLLTIGEQN